MDDTIDINLRSAREVALRLLVEIGLVNRAGLESGPATDSGDAEEERFDLYAWLIDAGAASLLSHYEQRVLTRPVGHLTDEDTRELAFSLATTGLLAWALCLTDQIPATPMQSGTGELLARLPAPGDEIGQFVAAAQLRSLDEIAAIRELAEIWCWRIDAGIDQAALSSAGQRELRQAIRDTLREARQAGFPIDEIDSDFAFQQQAVRNLDEETMDELWWITQRNAKTLNWLCGYGDSWSDAPVFIE